MFFKLLDLLKETGFTFEEIALNLGVTRQTLYNKIYGISPWKLEEMEVLKNIINGTVNEKYTIEDIFEKTEKSEKK